MKNIILTVLIILLHFSLIAQNKQQRKISRYVHNNNEFCFQRLNLKPITSIQKYILNENICDFNNIDILMQICFEDAEVINEINLIRENSSDSISPYFVSIEKFSFNKDTLYDVVVNIFNKAPSQYEEYYHFVFTSNLELLFKCKLFSSSSDFIGDFNGDTKLDFLIANWESENAILFSFINPEIVNIVNYQIVFKHDENKFYPIIDGNKSILTFYK